MSITSAGQSDRHGGAKPDPSEGESPGHHGVGIGHARMSRVRRFEGSRRAALALTIMLIRASLEALVMRIPLDLSWYGSVSK